jgi:hypothetical protein
MKAAKGKPSPLASLVERYDRMAAAARELARTPEQTREDRARALGEARGWTEAARWLSLYLERKGATL